MLRSGYILGWRADWLPGAWPALRWAVWAGLGLIILLGAAIAWRRFTLPPRPSPTVTAIEPSDDEFAPPAPANPGYLGPEVCAACHAERVAEFRETRHYLANCVPHPQAMPAGFTPEQGTYVAPENPSLRFEMSGTDGEFQQTTIWKTPGGNRKIVSPIAFVYGSAGGNDEVYFTWRDDRLYELPMVWLAPTAEWGASPFDRHGTGDLARDMTIRCVECHNTWFEYVPGSRNQYGRENLILGVTCEVCHGPGREHVAFHRDHPDDPQPHAVVRPARFARDRQIDLCAQCHSNALKHKGPAFRYRPGEPLEDFYFTLRTSHPEDDHVANQTTYLRQSRCFQESGTLTCTTCHNPHQHRSATNAGAASCAKCHAPAECTERPRLPAAVQDDCVACHMPSGRKIQVYMRTEDDSYVAPVRRYEHRIGIYPAARDEVLWNWHRTQPDPESIELATRLSKSLGEYWRTAAESRRREYRYLAAIDACREALHFDSDPPTREALRAFVATQTAIDGGMQDGLWHEQERRYDQAIDAFQRVLALKPDLAKAHGKLGTNYAVVGKKELALEHLRAAARFDPDEPYAMAMLGWLAYLDGRAEEALEHYRQADEVEPYSAKINWQMGLALSRLERWSDAAARFAKVVEIDPNDAGGFHGLGQALRRQGKPDEAVRYARRAARLTRDQDPEILLNLAEAYADAGRRDDAAETAAKALDAAQAGNRRLEPKIRARLEELRSQDGRVPAAKAQ